MSLEYRVLEPFELESLQAFAAAHSKKIHRHRGCATWKDELSMIYWYNARIGEGPKPGMGNTLHAIRNEFGPTWLYDVFKLPKRAS